MKGKRSPNPSEEVLLQGGNMSNNNNRKPKCRDCRKPIDLGECENDKTRYRAKQLGICRECQRVYWND